MCDFSKLGDGLLPCNFRFSPNIYQEPLIHLSICMETVPMRIEERYHLKLLEKVVLTKVVWQSLISSTGGKNRS